MWGNVLTKQEIDAVLKDELTSKRRASFETREKAKDARPSSAKPCWCQFWARWKYYQAKVHYRKLVELYRQTTKQANNLAEARTCLQHDDLAGAELNLTSVLDSLEESGASMMTVIKLAVIVERLRQMRST